MTQRGGKREGAGRKKAKSTIEKEKMREYLVERVRAEMGAIIGAQIALALGVKIAGSNEVYAKAPDLNAARYLLDQTIGKPRETIDQNLKTDIPLAPLLLRALERGKLQSGTARSVTT